MEDVIVTKSINTPAATRKWWAYKDASMRNVVNATHYSDKQRLQMERMKLAMSLVYAASGIYLNYRKGFATIKVSNARVKDAVLLAELEQGWNALGMTKVVSQQGVIYRVPRT